MCEFCDKHGRGNRWYLNPENFSDAMLEDPKRTKTLEEVAGWGIGSSSTRGISRCARR